MEEEYEIIYVPNKGRAIKNNKTKRIYYSEFQIIEEKNKEIERLKANYERIYNENCKLRENHNINDITLLDEIERLNNIIDELEDSIVGKINVLYQVRGQSNAIQELNILLRQLRELKGEDNES